MPPLVLSHVFLFFLSSSNPRTRKGGTGICVPSPSGCFSRCACPTPSLSLSEEKVRPSRSLLRLGWERWNGTVIPVFIPGMDGRTHPFAWQRTGASIHPPVEWILLGNGTRREGDRTRTIPSGGDGSGFRVWKRTDSPFFFLTTPRTIHGMGIVETTSWTTFRMERMRMVHAVFPTANGRWIGCWIRRFDLMRDDVIHFGPFRGFVHRNDPAVNQGTASYLSLWHRGRGRRQRDGPYGSLELHAWRNVLHARERRFRTPRKRGDRSNSHART